MTTVPILGELTPSKISNIMGTFMPEYAWYVCPEFPNGKIAGWGKANGNRADILSVTAVRPAGRGFFREFVQALKGEYGIIAFWLCSDFVTQILSRYGFVEVVEIQNGEIVKMMRWDRP